MNLWPLWAASSAVLGLTPPADLHPPLTHARAALASGDIFGWAQARADHLDRGGIVEVGAWGRLEDLAALYRCLELPPWRPAAETRSDRAARALLRLEQVRLQRHRIDRAHPGSTLGTLVAASRRLRVAPPPREDVIRWPIEAERWPGERLEPSPTPSRCGVPEETRRDALAARRRLEAERTALTALLPDLDVLPPGAAVRVAHAYLDAAAEAGPDFELSSVWLERLLAAAQRHEGPYARRAGLAAARRWLEAGSTDARILTFASNLLEQAEVEPPLRDAARMARVIALAEDHEAVARAATWPAGAAPSPGARAWLDYARARALAAQGLEQELEVFGRAFVRRAGATEADDRTRDLLLQSQLRRSVPEALAAAASFGEPTPAAVRARWWSLGRRALDANRPDIAKAVFDRLWGEAEDGPADDRGEVGVADILSQRARVAWAEGDVDGFADLVDQLLAESGAGPDPKARRAFIGLVQDLMPRLVKTPPSSDRARAAARLLAGVKTMSKTGRRLEPRLEAAEIDLAKWAGPFAEGRRPPPRPSRRRPRTAPKALGQVTIPRAPPPLPPPWPPIPALEVDSFVVWIDPQGRAQVGLPPEIAALGAVAP